MRKILFIIHFCAATKPEIIVERIRFAKMRRSLSASIFISVTSIYAELNNSAPLFVGRELKPRYFLLNSFYVRVD